MYIKRHKVVRNTQDIDWCINELKAIAVNSDSKEEREIAIESLMEAMAVKCVLKVSDRN